MGETQKRLLWRGVSATAAAVSVIVTRRLFSAVWKRVRGAPPPEGRKVTFGAAMTWAVALGVGVGIARFLAVRLSARAWEAATHEAPPDVT